MAEVQPPQKKVPKTPVKKKSPPASKKPKITYCILCRSNYLKHDAHEHMHSMLHHRELETVLGKDASHDCQACMVKSLGLNQFAKHVSTAQHKMKLKNLKTKNIKPVSLFKSLSTETITRILNRNKALKKVEKKSMKKNKKKQKQEAEQKQMKMQPGVGSKKTLASQVATQGKSKQKQTKASKSWQRAPCDGSNGAVVQNKENKTSSLQRPIYCRGAAFHNASWRPNYHRGAPGGQPFHHHYCQDQFPPSAHHLRFHPFLGNKRSRFGNFQNSSFSESSDGYQTGAFDVPTPDASPAVSRGNYYDTQYNYATSNAFTSDQLPESGTLLFDPKESANTESPQLEGSSCSAQPASGNTPAGAAPVRDVDVSAVLKQIRRELGVREPCRADREARKQSSEAGVGAADGSGVHRTEGTLSLTVVAPQAGASAAPVKPKQTSSRETQETGRSFKMSSAAEEERVNGEEGEPQLARDASSSLKITVFEPNLNLARKVRIAHKAAQGDNSAPRKLVLDKLLSFSGAKSKLSWREMYNVRKRRSLEDKSRFRTELVNQLTDNESAAQDGDLSLSEGFQWESLSDRPLVPPVSLPPPPPPSSDADTETPTAPRPQDPTETPPGAAQAACSSQPVLKVSVKAEPNEENETGELRGENNADKRKRSKMAGDGVSGGKKKKTKSNKEQSQMDQLLAVSLREDELSRSFQDLDKSLIQARNALQAAYAEVQRLLLLRQQFSAEVNGLRAKRIEILQGMQEGYPAAASSSAAPPPSFTSQQPPAAAPASSIAHPPPAPLALSAVAVKQDVSHFATTEQAAFPKAAEVLLNQPALLFPSDVLPPMLLQPSHLSTSFAQQPAAESSTSAKLPVPGPPAGRPQEQEARAALKGCGKTEVLAQKAQPSESESAPPPAGDEEPAANKTERKPSDEDNGGSESDSSVEMIDSSNLEVIDIDESDGENSAERNPAVQPEAPQRPASVEVSSASTQTAQQDEPESKFQPSVTARKDASPRPESVEDDEPSLGSFSNHAGPVHGLQVHDGLLYTCSADNTARAYSLMTRECEAIFQGHTNKVNCLLVSSGRNAPTRLYTGSSDETIRCYSIKSKKCLEQISLPDRVLCLHIAWNILYAGLANGSVTSYDLKTLKELDVFECHGPRGVSCLGTAQEGARRLLLVGSYDSTISVRDAKNGLLLRSLEGHTKTVLCMKVVNDLVFSGSSDTSIHAHNIHTGELLRIYKGHGHAVTSIVILGKVMVTACLDKLVRVYELQSHDRLQVYGGHSDMVMCMAVHKSVIYTGCYDGTVQAVKLNLMKNHRCWWQGCSLIFGVPEHLVHHLTRDHSNPNLQTVKCRWKDCNAFFATQQAVRQELPEHMQSHVENDSKPQP
ncbi:zinc finger protein 106 [Kryptolebias marmoratus]|uniref:Zinc finger protein 106-like n=1 Tax=Kryptolebias marmoratus TaxID=37003 RepID=A0A3Q3B3R5_KRYMA|nr:zinc finger protein 106 [Kryptolebias marmoratus]